MWAAVGACKNPRKSEIIQLPSVSGNRILTSSCRFSNENTLLQTSTSPTPPSPPTPSHSSAGIKSQFDLTLIHPQIKGQFDLLELQQGNPFSLIVEAPVALLGRSELFTCD